MGKTASLFGGRAAFAQLCSVPDGLLEIDSSSPLVTDRPQQGVWPLAGRVRDLPWESYTLKQKGEVPFLWGCLPDMMYPGFSSALCLVDIICFN